MIAVIEKTYIEISTTIEKYAKTATIKEKAIEKLEIKLTWSEKQKNSYIIEIVI